jgi:hypothetical protein
MGFGVKKRKIRAPRSELAGGNRTSFTRIPEGTALDFKNKSPSITTEIEIGEEGADGMLVIQGGRFG